MGLLITLILGGLAGWIASMLMGRDGQMGVLMNVIVGIVGAFLANVLLAPLLGVGARLDTLSLEGFLVAIGGAVILLALVNLFQRGSLR